MSRLSKRAIAIPEKVKVEEVGRIVNVTGPLGKLHMQLNPEIKLKIEENKIVVDADGEQRGIRILKGLTWSMIRTF